MKRVIAFLSLIAFSLPVWAETINPTLYLSKLTAVKTSEAGGDELYIDITTYPSKDKGTDSKEKATHFQVPAYPLSWPSRAVGDLADVKLWGKALEDGKSVTLIISLIEQDSPPWDTDDLIGTIRLRVKNNGGKLESSWTMPNRADEPASVSTESGQAQRFYLTGDNSRYELFLMLKENDN